MGELSDLDLRRQRAALNEDLFRRVNERIESASSTASFVSFVCECPYEKCEARVPLTIEEYEHVRSQPNRFVVLPGHEDPELELIQTASDRYLIVSKLGAGAQAARELDPRSR